MLEKVWASKEDWDEGTYDNLYCPIGLAQLELAYDELSGKATYVFDGGAGRKFNWQSFTHTKENAKTIWRDDFREDSLSKYHLEALGNPWPGYTAPTYDSVSKRVLFNTGDDKGTFLRPKNVTVQNFILSHNFVGQQCYPGNFPIYPCGRWVDQSNMYLCCIDYACGSALGSPRMAKLVGGSATALVAPGSTYYSLNTEYQIILTINGSSLEIEVPGLASKSATDGQFPNAGGVKFGAWQGRGWLDDFLLEHYSLPDPVQCEVTFRFATSANGVDWDPWETDIADCDNSRYIKIEAMLARTDLGASAMPVLEDMTVGYKLLVQPSFI